MSAQARATGLQPTKSRRLVTTLGLALSLGLTGGLLSFAPEVRAADPQVVVSYQLDDSGFVIARESVDVHPGLAAEYGYSYGSNVAATDLSAIDALVAAHILVYGKDVSSVNDCLALSASGFMTTAFCSPSSVLTYVNGDQPHTANGDATFEDTWNGGTSYTGDAVNQAVIKADDVVEFFTVQDTDYWMDNFGWFAKGENKVEELVVEPGEQINLTVQGLMNWYSLFVPKDKAKKITPLEDVAVVPVDIDKTGGWRVGIFNTAKPLATSADDGSVSFSYDTEGTYYVSAYQLEPKYSAPLFSPWLKVTVAKPGSTAEPTPTAPATTEPPTSVPPTTEPPATDTAPPLPPGWFTPYKVTFNANKGKVSTKSKMVKYRQKYGALPTPKRSFKVFDGWYTAKSGGTKVTSSSLLKKLGNVTLYAHWKNQTAKVANCYATNVRKQPSSASARKMVIRAGTKVELLTQKGKWYKVRVGKKTGWIISTLIKK